MDVRQPIPTRHVLEAVLWILNTGAQLHMLPQSYPNYKTVHRGFQTWCMTIMAIVDRHDCRSRSARMRRTITKSAWCSYASTST